MGKNGMSADQQVTVTMGKWRGLRLFSIVITIISLALLITLIVIFIERMSPSYCSSGKVIIPRNFENPGLFEDLTPKELKIIRDYMLGIESLKLTSFDKATVNSSYIYMIELHLPLKSAMLEYLDGGHRQPERTAKVILFRGDMASPRVEEYLVGPLPSPTYNILVANPAYRRIPIPFLSRPVDSIEYRHILSKMLPEISEKLYTLFRESYGLHFHNCTKRKDCMLFYDVAPRGIQSGERMTWFWAFRDVEGFYLHPLGFEIQIDHASTDVRQWKVKRVVYNGQLFYNVHDLLRDYTYNKLKKIQLGMDAYDAEYSSYKRRGPQDTDVPVQGPRLVEPEGHRYTVDGQHLQYFSWNMNFRLRTSTGLQLFDVRFQEERIAYEISLQDATVFYSGYGPVAGSTNYYDTSWLLGASSFELVPGVDCPVTASFHDAYHFVDSGEPKHYRNVICIFEQNSGLPLRRHYGNDFDRGYDFYGGTVDNNLVIRTIANVWNYDYIFDYIFHLNGVIEIKVTLTGYVQATFALDAEKAYGSRIHDDVVATLHQHLFHYKVDLDVVGPNNRYATLDISRETVPHPWYPGVNKTQMRFDKNVKQREMDAVLEYNFDNPQYHIVYSEKNKNDLGSPRGYRIQHAAMTKYLLDGVNVTNAAGWARYQMAVTKFNDIEETSSSIYAQNDPFDPVLDFRRYIDNNDDIVDEDLVFWITAGVLHIPHAEDVPSTTTTGNQYAIYLRPFNYFHECPSMLVSDAVHITPENNYQKVNVDTFGISQSAACVQKEISLGMFNGSRFTV